MNERQLLEFSGSLTALGMMHVTAEDQVVVLATDMELPPASRAVVVLTVEEANWLRGNGRLTGYSPVS